MHLDRATSKYHLLTPLRRWPNAISAEDLAMCEFENESWAHMLHDEGNQEQPQRRGRGRHWWEHNEEVVPTGTEPQEERPGTAESDDSETWGCG